MNPCILFKKYFRVKMMLMMISAVILGGSTIFIQNCESNTYDQDVTKMSELFPLVQDHTHGATIVELPNGSLLAAWFQGSGERWADDVRIMGARLAKGNDKWSEPFIMADVPGFPDINPALFIDTNQKLWLTWYTVIANQWSTSLTKYRISDNYMQSEGPPEWKWQEVLHVKPGDLAERGIQPNDRFVKSIKRQVKEYAQYLAEAGADEKQIKRWEKWGDGMISKASGEDMMRPGYLYDDSGRMTEQKLGYPYFQRMGWQTKNKAFFTGNRLILPLYSDGFGFSLMAITDDGGKTWQFSEPLVGAGNIQAGIAEKKDGTIVAYMRDGGPPPKKMMVSKSKDKGMTWSRVEDSDLPNPGSGADIVTLPNGHWVIAYNDGTLNRGRQSLAVSISTNEGRSWDFTRHLETESEEGEVIEGSYPSIIYGKDGALHVIYSYHFRDRRTETIKYMRINEAWIKEGDQ